MIAKRTDIPLGVDGSTKMLPWIIAFMVYIATLAMAGGMILSEVAQTWSEGLTGSLTIQVPIDPDETDRETNKRITNAIAAIDGMAGIAKINVMAQSEIQHLLEPWLGQNIDPASLPIPRLITIVLDGDGPNMEELHRRLVAVIPDIVIDDHQLWQERLVSLMEALQLVAMVIVLIVGMAGTIIVVFATRGGLATHRSIIEVLHLIGARDSYIAKQFQTHASFTAFRGAILGVVFGGITILGLGYVANSLGGDMVSQFVLNIWQWLGLMAIPFITAGIAMLSARRTVITALKRMM